MRAVAAARCFRSWRASIIGVPARTARDLALAYDATQGDDPDDPNIDLTGAVEPTAALLDRGVDGLRVVVAEAIPPGTVPGGARGGRPDRGAALAPRARTEIPEVERARSAAMLKITATEGVAPHFFSGCAPAPAIDPAVRDRLYRGRGWCRKAHPPCRRRTSAAGTPTGAGICSKRSMRSWRWRTLCTVLVIGVQQTFMLDGVEDSLRPNIGIYTQPIVIGLLVVAVPVPLKPLLIGVQIIAAPWREDLASRVAHASSKKAPRPRRGQRSREPRTQVDLPEVVAEGEAGLRPLRAGARRPMKLPRRRNLLGEDTGGTSCYGGVAAWTGTRKIAAFRAAQALVWPMRSISKIVDHHLRRDFAVASMLGFFRSRLAPGKVGRQTADLGAVAEGWEVVAAHVSVVDEASVWKPA